MRARTGTARFLLASALAGASLPLPASGSPVPRPEHRISEDTTWTLAESPHRIEYPVLVERGVTLTIEPGVRVEAPGLEVAGALLARGTETAPIVFAGPDDTHWSGIVFSPDASPASAVEHAQIDKADRGLWMPGASAFPVHDTVFTGNGIALSIDNPPTNLTFTGNEFYSNRVAFRGRTSGIVGLYENDFWDNKISMLFRAQSPWECQEAPGIFDVHYNDILRAPDSRWFSFDVRASSGSGASGMVVRAGDNWWGTTREMDIRARLEPVTGLQDRVAIEWRPRAETPQTPTEPPQPAGTPSQESSLHGDPAYFVQVRHPRDRRCYRSMDVIRGKVFPGLGQVPKRIGVVLIRNVGKGCRLYDQATGRFSSRRECNRNRTFPVHVRSGNWRVPLERPLEAGRYTFRAGGDQVRFRILR